MSVNDDSEGVKASLAGLQRELEALSGRVAALETTLKHEHDDLLRLREETKADHRKLEGLSDTSGGESSSFPATPVGL